MNQQIKEQWLRALRSGEYRQAHGQLRAGAGYCCLGVLCALYTEATGESWSAFGDDDEVLPDVVVAWAGVPDENPVVRGYRLALYNDGSEPNSIRPHSFLEIADLIEEEL